MPQATLASVGTPAAPGETNALDQAFAALRNYQAGSSRAALLPIDDAVRAALGQTDRCQELEQRFIAILQTDSASAVAKEYVCGKLVLCGSAASVPALVPLLAVMELTHLARATLEALPYPQVCPTLRDCVNKLSGMAKVGVILALGMRRDPDSVPLLVPELDNSNLDIARAAIFALGRIGTVRAARALGQFLANAAPTLRAAVADACLVCAERLLQDGLKEEAKILYQILLDSRPATYIQQAAERGRQQITL